MESLQEGRKPYEQTHDVFSLHRKRVLAQSGAVIGHIKEVRMDFLKGALEGVVVSRFPRKPWFISVSFIERVTEEAVLLRVKPVMLLKGIKVITDDGEVVGKVRTVQRKEQTNALQALVIKPVLRKPITIKPDQIQAIGQSVMLKPSWRR